MKHIEDGCLCVERGSGRIVIGAKDGENIKVLEVYGKNRDIDSVPFNSANVEVYDALVGIENEMGKIKEDLFSVSGVVSELVGTKYSVAEVWADFQEEYVVLVYPDIIVLVKWSGNDMRVSVTDKRSGCPKSWCNSNDYIQEKEGNAYHIIRSITGKVKVKVLGYKPDPEVCHRIYSGFTEVMERFRGDDMRFKISNLHMKNTDIGYRLTYSDLGVKWVHITYSVLGILKNVLRIRMEEE